MKYGIEACRLPALIVALAFLLVAPPVPAQEDESLADASERALDIVRDHPRTRDILADFPDLRLVPEYSERYRVWVVSFAGENGRIGGEAAVSLEAGEVVEFSVDPRRLQEVFEEEGVWREERLEEGISLWRAISLLRPNLEGPALAWISLLLALVFLGDFSELFSRRNLDVLMLYALCPFLNVLWIDRRLAYSGLFVVTSLFFARTLIATRPKIRAKSSLPPQLFHSALLVLTFLVFFRVQSTFDKGIDDSGIWSVVGAEYLLEYRELPYGKPWGPNCVYGPLKFLAEIPGNLAFPPDVAFAPDGSEAHPGDWESFERRGVQSTTLAFDLLAIVALVLIGRRYATTSMGVLLAVAYALSPYLLGLGGAFGLQQSSHIFGIPFTLFAILLAAHPFASGLLLGCGAGMLYYHVFLVPLWAGYYFYTAGWRHALAFLTAIALVGFSCLAMIILMTEPAGERVAAGPVRAFLDDTVMQQQFKSGYGTSEFGFWGQYPAAAKWGKPAVGLLYLGFCVAIGLLPYRRSLPRLIALTAAALVGTQLVLSHGGGTYIGFYIAPFLVTLFGIEAFPDSPAAPETPEQRAT